MTSKNAKGNITEIVALDDALGGLRLTLGLSSGGERVVLEAGATTFGGLGDGMGVWVGLSMVVDAFTTGAGVDNWPPVVVDAPVSEVLGNSVVVRLWPETPEIPPDTPPEIPPAGPDTPEMP